MATAGRTRLAVAGPCSATNTELTNQAAAASSRSDIESALTDAGGSFHLLASVDGRIYARGSLSGQRRVYWARANGVTLGADRARTLARLTGAGIDQAQLSLCLAGVTIPWPLDGGALWHGVHALPPGEALLLDRDGRSRVHRWWQPPASDLPLPEAAPALRQALRDAVALRVHSYEMLAADLSGGMDSTSLCFLAAEAGASLVTVTVHWDALGNQDPDYAAYAAQRLPNTRHLVFPSAELPSYFTGLDVRHEPDDEPSAALRGRGQQRRLSEELRAHGAVRRLTGHGGDHVVQPPAAYLHGLLRSHPQTALRHTAGWRAKHRWPLTTAARFLLNGCPYRVWLADTAGQLRYPPVPAAPSMTWGWGRDVHLPPWASEQTVALVADALRTAARDAEPLDANRGRHAWIHQMHEAGRMAEHLAIVATAAGLPTDSPFCDDAVLTACLRARPHEAGDPWSYKPLLAAAMDGLVPSRILSRTTKDHSGTEWRRGLQQHRHILASWAETSRLVTAGLANEALLSQALISPGLLIGGAAELEATLGAEEWLRDLEAHPVPSYLQQTEGA